ncbi:MAG: hypothetical protein P8048_13085, partial [Calditrichia bacterium]
FQIFLRLTGLSKEPAKILSKKFLKRELTKGHSPPFNNRFGGNGDHRFINLLRDVCERITNGLHYISTYNITQTLEWRGFGRQSRIFTGMAGFH